MLPLMRHVTQLSPIYSALLSLYLGSQGDANNAAELVYAGLQLLQSLHVLVEVQLLCHGLCLHRASPSAGWIEDFS